jgi:hypothetical protein
LLALAALGAATAATLATRDIVRQVWVILSATLVTVSALFFFKLDRLARECLLLEVRAKMKS